MEFRAASGNDSLRSGLVVGEVALSMMLLVGASLMIRTLLAMKSGDLGARPDRVLTLRIPLASDRYPDANRRAAFLEEVIRRIAIVPGVRAAGINTGLPPIGNWTMPVEVSGAGQERQPPSACRASQRRLCRGDGSDRHARALLHGAGSGRADS